MLPHFKELPCILLWHRLKIWAITKLIYPIQSIRKHRAESKTIMNGKEIIRDLVAKYENNRNSYLSTSYNETQLRRDFLDPLFEAMGWDINNRKSLPTHEREVLLEESLRGSARMHAKKPDYTFRAYGERKFFLEAKKPSVHIHKDSEPAKQVRRYGYTAGLSISVLSNFEYLCIYETTVPVEESDSVVKARVRQYHYTEYEKAYEDLLTMLGRQSVYSGEFEKIWQNHKKRVSLCSVDKRFLDQIDRWRLLLGNQIFAQHPEISLDELGDIVQRYINKILFLRVCEDRNIEEYENLLKVADTGIFNNLMELFRRADRKYNSGLFAESEAEEIIGDISSSFWQIIRELYYPECPYSFSVFSSDILGRIYEIFLTRRIVLENGQLVLKNKPDRIDSDAVTTPSIIIKEILRQSIRWESIDGAPSLLQKRIADIACGSGAFLLEVFQQMCDFLIDIYKESDLTKVRRTGINTYKLIYAEKRQLLTRCIYGVDQDFNAVEACRFGLLLKLLEDEDEATLAASGCQPILPSLDNNICFGNSLIDSQASGLPSDSSIPVYDFGENLFDYIIGNPPYMKTEDIKNIYPEEYPIYKQIYTSANKQYDKYFLFIERALSLLKEGGVIGYILPNKFFKVGAAEKLRELLSSGSHVRAITSFGANQIFASKSTYTCILILTKECNASIAYTEVNDFLQWSHRSDAAALPTYFSSQDLGKNTWVLYPAYLRDIFRTKILKHSKPLAAICGSKSIFNGIQTSANDVYVINPIKFDEENSTYYFEQQGSIYQVEKEATKPYFETPASGETAALSSYRTLIPNARVIYPYEKKDGRVDVIPLARIKAKYPLLYRYLTIEKIKERLAKRDIQPPVRNEEEWYKYGRSQGLEACEVPAKIVVGVLSQADKYAIDISGALISSGGTAGYCMISLPEHCPYSPYYIQALLNSRQGEWMASLYGEIFRGGYIARGTKVLKQLPIAVIDFSDERQKTKHDNIVARQKKLIELGNQLMLRENRYRQAIILKRRMNRLKNEQQQEINLLYGMTEDDVNKLPNLREIYA